MESRDLRRLLDGHGIPHVARGAVGCPLKLRRLDIALLLQMTQIAGGLRYADVVSLDDLRVTARASQFLAASQVTQMWGVVEGDTSEPNGSL